MNGDETIPARFRIDAKQSRFIVNAEAFGLLSVFGHNPVIAICGFGGDAQFHVADPDKSSLLMLVQSNSLAVTGNVSEKDKLEMERAIREDVLETARYPEIIFMSKSVSMNKTAENNYRAKINGSLSLHGVTRDQTINAKIKVDEVGLRSEGEFALRQSDYRIKPVSAIGGTLKVKDELMFSFDIMARKSA
jgi:polyisoprenoid-binding protein YceI